jgi:hypothetical protein
MNNPREHIEEKFLLGDRFAPITSSYGFFDCEIEKLVADFMNWHAEMPIPRLRKNYSRQDISGDIEQAVRSLLPLRMGSSSRYLFLPTRNQWIAYFDNNYRGTDATAIGHLAERLKCRSVRIITKPNTIRRKGSQRKGRQGALILSVYGPEQTEWMNLIREIRLYNDVGKWEFSQSGTPFPFEETEKYKSKLLCDRFTFDMLNCYLAKLGISAFNRDYYLPPGSNALLLEEQGSISPQIKEIPLEEARKLNFIDN